MEISESRLKELKQLVSNKGMKIKAKDFTVSEIQFIIDETPLSDHQREGCIMFYIKKIKQKDIANYFFYSKSGIDYQKKKCSYLLRQTACRLFQ